MFATSILAADPVFSIGPTAPSGKETLLAVPEGGELTLSLIRTSAAGTAESADLQVSSFFSSAGHSVTVRAAVGAGQPGTMLHGIKLAGALVPVRLITPGLRAGSQYTGTLVLSVRGAAAPQVFPIVLTAASPRDAVVVADRNVLPLAVERSTFRGFPRPAVPDASLHLFDKNRKAPVDGIVLRQESSGTGQTLDMERHLAFWVNGEPIDRFETAAAALRAIPAGAQKTIGIAAHGLSAGEHSALLRFSAANSGDDDGQKVTLTVKVRHSIWGALWLLVAAGLISFLTTKIVVMVRQHLALRQKVRDLRRPWLRDMEPNVPVVWVRAMLKQSEDLSKRYWLTGGNQIEARLNQISGLLPVLQRIGELRKQLCNALSDTFVRRRALAALGRIVSQLDAQALAEVAAAQRKAELDALSAWLDPSGLERSYWDAVLPPARQMISTVKLGSLPGKPPAEMQVIIDDLEKDLAALKANPAPELGWKIAFEQKYARLKVLWAHFERPEYADLARLQGEPLIQVFKAADLAAWKRLINGKPEIVCESTADMPEAYTPLAFRLATPQDPGLQDTYLISRGLLYEWQFKFTPRLQHLSKSVTFLAKSAEPTVVVYAPGEGALSASVKVQYDGGNPIEITTAKPIQIRSSGEFTLFGGFERIELISFAIAFGIALVSGLSLFYFRNPAFGTPQDYVNLFLWGVGVDQGKNLIQGLQTPSKVASA
jgi:hypothetical protein